jgi:hypothetical protein
MANWFQEGSDLVFVVEGRRIACCRYSAYSLSQRQLLLLRVVLV